MIADYFVIASGSNLNQVQAMVDNVEEQLGVPAMNRNRSKEQEVPTDPYGLWAISSSMCFDEENRLFYDLEKNLERWKRSRMWKSFLK